MFGTPLAYAAIGELIGERSGILNLGLEGTMLLSAVTAFGVSTYTGSLWLALAAGIAAGALMSSILAFLAIVMRANQVLAGLGLLILGTGLSSYIGQIGDDPLVGLPPAVSIEPFLTSGLADIPVVGPILFSHDFVLYGGWALAIATHFFFKRTDWGLRVRAVGKDPASAEAAGVSVARVRSLAVIIGGALAGVGGAYYALAVVKTWTDGLTSGAGWLAITIVLAVRWRPLVALGGAFVFGASIRLGFSLQVLGIGIPPQLLSMIPYLLAMIAVLYSAASSSRSVTQPNALTVPYFREER